AGVGGVGCVGYSGDRHTRDPNREVLRRKSAQSERTVCPGVLSIGRFVVSRWLSAGDAGYGDSMVSWRTVLGGKYKLGPKWAEEVLTTGMIFGRISVSEAG